MIRFLVDEMYATEVAVQLRDKHGRDAVHVAEVGLRATEVTHIAAVARAEGRALVTENVADFAGETDLVLVVVPKKTLPAGGGQAAALASLLHHWAEATPTPYLGAHWPA